MALAKTTPYVLVGLLGGFALRECYHTYHYVFSAVLHHDKTRRGLDHEHPSVNQLHMRTAGAAGAVGVGSASYFFAARVLESALFAAAPDPAVLVDAPVARAPLTLAVLARALSPRVATRASVTAFFAAHGGVLLARGFAGGWSFLVLAPAAQAWTMSHFAHVRSHEEHRASAFGRSYRRDTEGVVDLAERLADRSTG